MIKGYLKNKPTQLSGKLNKEIIKVGTIIEYSNAKPEDVVIGKTFYSSWSPDRQTGTLKAYDVKQDNDTLHINSISPFTGELNPTWINNLTINDKEIPVGLDTSDGNITPDKVAKNYIGYAKGEKVVGELVAYDVEEQILAPNKSRIVINKVANEDTKDFITTKQNIEMMKSADYIDIIQNGGELASDEEYEKAELKFQQLASIIMGVSNE